MERKYVVLIVVIALIISLFISFKVWVNYNKKVDQIPVLMYHDVIIDEYFKDKPDTIELTMFEKQLKYLKDKGYKTLSLDEFYCWKKGECEFGEKTVVLTFDDGFYSFEYLVKPLLEKYNMTASVFLIGEYTDELTPEFDPNKYGTVGIDNINNELDNAYYGSHTFALHKMVGNKKRVETLTYEEIDADFKSMKEIYDFEYMTYPFNTDTKDFIRALKNNNYKLAFRGESEKATKSSNDYLIPRIGVSNNFESFKAIFETDKHNNRYGSGFLRKVFITLERKLKIKLG